jgi:uncharacterized protein
VRDDEFEGDDAKAISNGRTHGISFEAARAAFADRFGIASVDRRHPSPEERFALLGMVENRLLFVSYTVRGDRIRLISARNAEPHERRRYHNENREI